MVTLRTHIIIFGGMNKLLQKNYFLKNAKETFKPNKRFKSRLDNGGTN